MGYHLEIEAEPLKTPGATRLLATRKVKIGPAPGTPDARPRVLGAAIDITGFDEQRKNDQKLLQDLMEYVGDGIFFKDKESRFIRVNRALAALVGKTPDEFVGKQDIDVFKNEDYAAAALAEERELFRTGRPTIPVYRETPTLGGKQIRFTRK